MSPRTLFVYGTLAPDKAPAEIASDVARLKRVGRGSIRGEIRDLGDYPGAVLDAKSATKIHGSVYELPDDPSLLSRLDEYEEYDSAKPQKSLFLRERKLVAMEDGSQRYCWIYTYNPKR
jgi:gamma-glutamylcyclotransferase (GGCT)/AIG2-like uncharacterized protein YtfP